VSDLLIHLSGFAWGVLHDIAALRGTPHVKPFLFMMSAAGHVVGWYRLMRYSSRWAPPAPLRAVCLVAFPVMVCAMFYSILIKIPFRKAWIEEGHTDELITTGPYALTRHPGVLWYALAVFAAAVATRSRRLLVAAPVLIAADVAHVAFQEREVLTRVFGDAYREYQQTTPFVIPTPESIARFVETARSDGSAARERDEALVL